MTSPAEKREELRATAALVFSERAACACAQDVIDAVGCGDPVLAEAAANQLPSAVRAWMAELLQSKYDEAATS